MPGASYFAYGSNMDEALIAERCPSATDPRPGRLEDFRLEFNVYSDRWGGGAANLEPDPSSYVWGVVWQLDPEDFKHLDTFSGHPTFYRRERVVAMTDDGQVECMTYRVAHQHGYVRPTEEYLSRVRTAIVHHGLPEEALDILDRAARPPSPRIST